MTSSLSCAKCYLIYGGDAAEEPQYCPGCREMFESLKRSIGINLCCINDSSRGHYGACHRKKSAQPSPKPIEHPKPEDALQRQLDLQKKQQHDQRLNEYRRLDPNRPH